VFFDSTMISLSHFLSYWHWQRPFPHDPVSNDECNRWWWWCFFIWHTSL